MSEHRLNKGNRHQHFSIELDRHLLSFILSELRKHPKTEDGGKYIGYLGSSNNGVIRVQIPDFLPGGPGAVRTKVEFLPDGEYQEKLFRRAERRDGNIEHLGTWHSHHCNGLPTLSSGDLTGYHRTVNNSAYRLDVFIASLVKYLPNSALERGWIDHYLFLRGDNDYYLVTDDVVLVDQPTRFGDITSHTPERDTPLSRNDDLLAIPQGDSPWYESELGRRILAEDRTFFVQTFDGQFKALRKNGRISLFGRSESKSIQLCYPEDLTSTLQIDVSIRDSLELSINCTIANRHVALAAAVKAMELLQ